MKKVHVTLLASAAVFGFGSGAANAVAYSFVKNEITNFQIRVLSGDLTVGFGSGSRGNINQTTFNGEAGPNGSRSMIQLVPNSADAPQAYSGPNGFVVPENTYTDQAGRLAGLNGTRADANTLTGSPFVQAGGTVTGARGTGTPQVNNVAEAQTGANEDRGTADARNTLNTEFVVSVAPGGASLQFSFTDDYALFASTTDTGEVAQATTGNAFTILNNNGVVFDYAPNEINLTGSSIGGGAAFDVNPGPTDFTSSIASLAAGRYNISVRSESQLNVVSFPTNPPVITDVSEPTSFALLGAGLVGLGMIRRRKAV